MLSIQITPFSLKVEEKDTFAVLRIDDDVSIILDTDHIKQIGELLNFLYKVKLDKMVKEETNELDS
jgi:hypothetical protein